MKKYLTYCIAIIGLLAAFSMSGCKTYNRQRTMFSGDHNVTIVRKPSRKPIKGNQKPITKRAHYRSVN